MSFISLLAAKFHQNKRANKLKYFPAIYASRFYSNLVNNVYRAVNSDFNGRIANDVDIPYKDVFVADK